MGFIDYGDLKTRVTIHDAIQKLGLELKKAGHQLRGFCPACKAGGDRTLVVTPDKGLFYCFNAKTGGDQIALVAHIQGLKTNEAANWLAGTVPQNNTKTSPATVPPAPPTKFDPSKYAESLKTEGAPLNPDTCQAWQCGMAFKGVLRGRLALPVADLAGNVVAYIGRDEKGHYLHPNGFEPQAHIFGAHKLEAGEVRILSEPLEVIQAFESGVQALCFLTDTVSAEQVEMLASVLDQKKCELVF